ncbi:MAG: hypothetical protein IKX33_11990 [Prevotella sp.]|nr:hypothetical protein [Prevotella sp.]
MKKLLFIFSLFSVISCVNAQSVSILGDSYSTFEGYVEPSTNEMWYYEENGNKTDVNDVTDTWWWQVINEGGLKLCKNNSYSGSTIGYRGYDGNDYAARSFLTRMDDLGCPDILFIFGATNDSWAGEPVGEYKYEGWTKADFYTFRPAMAYMLHHVKRRYPNVHIYFLLNSELREDITNSCLEICRHYDISCIQLQEIHKINGHPSVKGMKSISQQILKRLREDQVINN